MQKSNLVRDRDGWETVGSETHFANPHLSVAIDEVRTPTQRSPRKWAVVLRKPAVVIAPLTREGKFVLIREERIPIRAAIWSMPAGQIDDAVAAVAGVADPGRGEDGPLTPTGVTDPGYNLQPHTIAAVARRELLEETGYELEPGAELVSLGHHFTSPGFTDEHCYFFLARPVRKSAGGPQHDATEAIVDCREFSADAVRQMIAESEICDANTLGIWAQLVARGEISA